MNRTLKFALGATALWVAWATYRNYPGTAVVAGQSQVVQAGLNSIKSNPPMLAIAAAAGAVIAKVTA